MSLTTHARQGLQVKTIMTKNTFKDLTPDEKDSLVLSAIIGQAALEPKRAVKPFTTHDGVTRGNYHAHAWGHVVPDGPCCAVGAGILFKNLGPLQAPAIETFAKSYGVSFNYAHAVSTGFENALESDLSVFECYPDANADYRRGFQVGKAAFEALHGGGV